MAYRSAELVELRDKLIAARLQGLGFFEWAKVIRRTKLTTSAKAVALILGSYADTRTGHCARPGQARLAREAGLTDRSTRTHLRELERWGLVYCVRRGNNVGKAGAASEYVLTAPEALLARLDDAEESEVIDPAFPPRTTGSQLPEVGEGHRKSMTGPPEEIDRTTGRNQQDHRKPASAYLPMTSAGSFQKTSSSGEPQVPTSPAVIHSNSWGSKWDDE